MLKILQQQQIDIYHLGKNMSQDGKTFEPQWAYVVPAGQPKYRLIRGIFDRATTFEDSLFYDISAWSLPLAFNMPYIEAKATPALGAKVETVPLPEGQIHGNTDAYAYAFSWNNYYAPRTLYSLMQKGYQLRVAKEPITALIGGKKQIFDYGSILIPVGIQSIEKEQIYKDLLALAKRDGIEIAALQTGLTPGGLDLGSANFAMLTMPRVLLLVGAGVNANDAGEVWHLLDQRYAMPPTMIDIAALNRINLSKYTTVVMVGGTYGTISKSEEDKLRSWIQNGGTLITMTEAIRWGVNRGFTNVKLKTSSVDSVVTQRNYVELERYQGAQLIAGAIFQAKLDRTHPLSFGYAEEWIPVFRDHTLFMEKPKNPYAAPLVYTGKPLISGYVHANNEKQLRNSAGIVVSNLGAGKVILMADNTNFRAFWSGTNKLFMNAIFFSPIINSSAGRVDN
jgi:hypothetical protein